MRFVAFLLIWISLAVGAVTATSAYLWAVPGADEPGGLEFFQIDRADEKPIYAVLAADAGKDKEGKPIAHADTSLTPEVVKKLQAAGVKRVRVKTFKFSRWSYWPLFAAAAIGLVAGSLLSRIIARRAAVSAEEQTQTGEQLSPDAALAAVRKVIDGLLEDLQIMTDEERACDIITTRVDEAVRGFVPAITESRDRLVARMGLGAYASFMDLFSAGERSLNRAWSAAADGAAYEAAESLERAHERLAVAADRLSGRTPSLLPLA